MGVWCEVEVEIGMGEIYCFLCGFVGCLDVFDDFNWLSVWFFWKFYLRFIYRFFEVKFVEVCVKLMVD